MIDNDKIQALLAARGRAGANIMDYSLHDHRDGRGVVIGKWDESKLGPKPQMAELEAVPVPLKPPIPPRVKLEQWLAQADLTIADLKKELGL